MNDQLMNIAALKHRVGAESVEGAVRIALGTRCGIYGLRRTRLTPRSRAPGVLQVAEHARVTRLCRKRRDAARCKRRDDADIAVPRTRVRRVIIYHR